MRWTERKRRVIVHFIKIISIISQLQRHSFSVRVPLKMYVPILHFKLFNLVRNLHFFFHEGLRDDTYIKL